VDNRVDKIFCEYDKCNKKSVIFAEKFCVKIEKYFQQYLFN